METALELFMTEGYTSTSLQQIADRIGVTKAALYYHFRSKSELAQSVIYPALHDFDILLNEAEAAEMHDPRSVLSACFDTFAEHRGIFLAMTRDPSLMLEVDIYGPAMGWFERLQILIQGDDASDEAQVRALVAIGGISRATMLLDSMDPEMVRRVSIDAACAALGSPPSPSSSSRNQ